MSGDDDGSVEPPRPTTGPFVRVATALALAVCLLWAPPATAATGVGSAHLGWSDATTEYAASDGVPDVTPAVAAPDDTASDDEGAEILTVYPNPVAAEDAGEYVLVEFPRETSLHGWSVADDEAAVDLPQVTVAGRVAISATPAATRNVTDARVVGVDDAPALSNGGETVWLRRDGAVVDRVAYAGAPEGERWNASVGEWRPLGATDFAVRHRADARATAFVLPDTPSVVVETLRNADRRVLLAGYSFTSRRVADALVRAAAEGVRVRVLLDAAPVGGASRREAALLDDLVRRGVEVGVLGGPLARYDYHHAKYAVVDDSALVLTENWKPAGTGGRSSRGWGVVVDDPRVAADLAAVFRADAGWRDAAPWERYRRNRSFNDGEAADERFPSRFSPRSMRIDAAEVVVAPDNAEARATELLRGADRSIRVQQVSVGGRNTSLLRETLAAARRGVRVRVLLSSAWYVREENARLVEWLNERARREGLPLRAKLADPRSRYEKIHAKGVVVDGERVLLGSINWNENALQDNREVALVLSGDAVGGYYARVFRADWRGGAWRFPASLAGPLAAVALVGVLVGRRRIRFVPPDERAR